MRHVWPSSGAMVTMQEGLSRVRGSQLLGSSRGPAVLYEKAIIASRCGSRLRISCRSWLLTTCPPLSPLVGATGGWLLSALGVACGGLSAFSIQTWPCWLWQAVFNPSFVSSQAGVRVHERGEYLGYVIKSHTWHRDLVLMYISHLLAFPGHCPQPWPVD